MNPITRIESIQQGHHGCVFYHQIDDLHTIALSFLKRGLSLHERCVYMADPLSIARFTIRLVSAGINVTEEVNRGALVITSDRTHLQDGRFDASRMIEFLGKGIEEALRCGFTGLRATGDVVWELGSDVDMKKLADYEIRLDEFFHGKKLTGLCQYNCNVIPVEYLRRALHCHNLIVLDDNIYTENQFYGSELSPESFEEMCASLRLARAG